MVYYVPYKGLKIKTPSGTIQLALVPYGTAQGLRICKGGTVYDIRLVDPSDPKASPLRIKTPAGIKAVEIYSPYYDLAESLLLEYSLISNLRLTENSSTSDLLKQFRTKISKGISIFESLGVKALNSLEDLLSLTSKILLNTSHKESNSLTDLLTEMNFKIPKNLSVSDVLSYGITETQTRYFRSDDHTVNGLTAKKLLTSQSGTSGVCSRDSGTGYNSDVKFGIRVWKRSSGGTETEITDGTPVAQVTILKSAGNWQGIKNASWDCPETSLGSDDSIVVRVYVHPGDSWKECATWSTEDLNATKLKASTWEVYYYVRRYYNSDYEYTRGYFYYDTSTYNSRITNFKIEV